MTTTAATHPADAARAQGRPGFGAQGIWILVGSLGVLFTAGIALFVLVRTGLGGHLVHDPYAGARIALPAWLWVSTFFLFVSSVALHQGRQWIALGYPGAGIRSVQAAVGLGWLFAGLQVPGLIALVGRYRPPGGVPSPVYFIVLLLVALHALHAVGGLAAGTALTWRPGPASLEVAGAARLGIFAIYWQFVVGVWLALFATFCLV